MSHEPATKTPSELLYLEDLYVGRRFTSGTHALDERQIELLVPRRSKMDSAIRKVRTRSMIGKGVSYAAVTTRSFR